MQLALEKLDVWRDAVGFVTALYEATGRFPAHEQFGITSQIRRAAVSIAANIAEGKGRYSKKEFLQFLYLARGSVYEVMTLLQIAAELGYLKRDQHDVLAQSIEGIARKLGGLINSLKV